MVPKAMLVTHILGELGGFEEMRCVVEVGLMRGYTGCDTGVLIPSGCLRFDLHISPPTATVLYTPFQDHRIRAIATKQRVGIILH